MSSSNLKTFTLSNGDVFPSIGYGTYKVAGASIEDIVADAIRAGYRLIDGAALYGNEVEVGRGIAKSGVPREQLKVTSKVPPEAKHYDDVIAAANKTLEDLGLDYLDLYLVHWPANATVHPDQWNELNMDTWAAMIELYRQKKVRAIGVSNFKIHHLEPLMKTDVKPMVNQIEFHPGYTQPEIVDYCIEHDIVVEAWSPLGRTRVLQLPLLEEIAKETGKTTAQICIRYALQKHVLPLPKSSHYERMKANLDVFDFSLTPEPMEAIDNLPETGYSGLDPDTNPVG